MKELNPQEMEMVSAAGFFANMGGTIGKFVGGLVDAGASWGGITTNVSKVASTMGTGIGSIIEFNFINGVLQIGSAVIGMLGTGVDVIKQVATKVAAN